MARTVPPGRLRQLVDAATRVFIAHGYARAQMADVASAMGIAKGTLYLYVESKEALFDLALRCAAGESADGLLAKLPLATPKPGATLRFVRKRLEEQPPLPTLTAALTRQTVPDPAAELSHIVRELYQTLGSARLAIKLMDRSAEFDPRLATLWFAEARSTTVRNLAEYLDNRIRRRLLRPVPDTLVAARVVMETIVTWAVHRHWDPSPQAIDDQVAEDTVVQFVVGGLAKEGTS